MKDSFGKQFVLMIVLGGGLAGGVCATSLPRPNVIIIFTDDQGYADLGCFDGKHVSTPRIDQMAKEGMRFTNFYAQTVCGPSRMMTGCYPLRLARQGIPTRFIPNCISTKSPSPKC